MEPNILLRAKVILMNPPGGGNSFRIRQSLRLSFWLDGALGSTPAIIYPSEEIVPEIESEVTLLIFNRDFLNQKLGLGSTFELGLGTGYNLFQGKVIQFLSIEETPNEGPI